MMKRNLAFAALGLFVLGCASASPTQKGAVAGSAVGAGIGAIIGHQSGHTAEGALIGAAAGGVGGAVIGDASAAKFCPTCGRSYTAGYANCPVDGTALRSKGAPPQTQTQQQANVDQSSAKFCPTCGKGYPSSATYCAEDGAALKTRK